MTEPLGKNIRSHRKAMGLTQEQLAEAMGVTVGAVSKWESGQSNPDIALLPVLADFFETSVDVLLGYRLSGRTADGAAEKIKNLTYARDYDPAAAEAEKALLRFPNHFQVVHSSASLFHMMGMDRRDNRLMERALALYERSLALIGQNRDESLSEIGILTDIGAVYESMGRVDEALAHLMKHNVGGVNNSLIGVLMAQNGREEESLGYLSESFLDSLANLIRVTVGFSNAFGKLDEPEEALDILRWMNGAVEGLKKPGRTSYLDKIQAMLLSGAALVCADMGDREEAERCLRRAADRARAFDAAPDYTVAGMRFYRGKTGHVGDDFGATAMSGVRDALLEDKENGAALLPLWEEICHEETGGE